MTIYVAVDAVTGVALPDGRVAGHHDSLAGLRAAGYSADPYSAANNRLVEIDETTNAWNNDCEIGWGIVSGAVQRNLPLTALEQVQAHFRHLHGIGEQLSVKLSRQAEAGWHSPELVNKGRAWIYHALHEAAYMVGLNTTFSHAVKARWAITGAAVAAAILEEENAETLYNSVEGESSPTGPVLLVDPATGSRLTFATAAAITPSAGGYPAKPNNSDLGNGAWINNIA